jgi:hypothetical protein
MSSSRGVDDHYGRFGRSSQQQQHWHEHAFNDRGGRTWDKGGGVTTYRDNFPDHYHQDPWERTELVDRAYAGGAYVTPINPFARENSNESLGRIDGPAFAGKRDVCPPQSPFADLPSLVGSDVSGFEPDDSWDSKTPYQYPSSTNQSDYGVRYNDAPYEEGHHTYHYQYDNRGHLMECSQDLNSYHNHYPHNSVARFPPARNSSFDSPEGYGRDHNLERKPSFRRITPSRTSSRVTWHPAHEPSNLERKVASMNKDRSKMIEVAPGEWFHLRGADETWRAIENDFFMPCTCISCGQVIFCIEDASFVVCPQCRVVTPMDMDSHDNDGGVGLGFTMEDLSKWQQDIERNRRVSYR